MNIFRRVALVTMVALTVSPSDAFDFWDVVQSGKDISEGTVRKLPDLLPKPETLLQSGKQILAGYPFEVAFQAVNQLCSIALSSDSVKPRITPDVRNMSFILMTPSKNYTFPLLDAAQMWTSPAFDKKKKVVVLITGWSTDLNEYRGDINTVAQAYFCRGDVNFVVVDSARYIDTLYTWSAFNTEEIGENVGRGLAELIKIVPRENIHLIGHSLGAHISGAAGRSFAFETKTLLPRITGLDPANPCFNEGESLGGLQRGDAEFIDIIHSNSGALGKRDPLGDVDFYPAGVTSLPPGCLDISCAHNRAWAYYSESVQPGNENNFLGTKCSSLYKLNAGKCTSDPVQMGFIASNKLKGNYFLDVNSKKPFGKNAPKTASNCPSK